MNACHFIAINANTDVNAKRTKINDSNVLWRSKILHLSLSSDIPEKKHEVKHNYLI